MCKIVVKYLFIMHPFIMFSTASRIFIFLEKLIKIKYI